jgi:hypothetical protein
MDSFEAQPGNKAAGTDKVSQAEYAQGVEERIKALSAGRRSLNYRSQPVRRVYIPKGNGKQRPLGMPCFEDRLVQHRLSGILQAIGEPEFRNCSYGFRPDRNAHQALARLGERVTNHNTQWLVEADIKGFFDYVACFTSEADARRFMDEMAERLAELGLEVEPSKTCLLRFGNRAATDCRKDSVKRAPAFNFLGFTHYVGKSRKGRFVLGRKSQRERIVKKLKDVGDRLSALRIEGGQAMMDYARRHLQGQVGYDAVSGNIRQVRTYAYRISRLLFKGLNRRSQRRSVSWDRFSEVLSSWMPSLRIRHNLYPKPLWTTQAGSRMV